MSRFYTPMNRFGRVARFKGFLHVSKSLPTMKKPRFFFLFSAVFRFGPIWMHSSCYTFLIFFFYCGEKKRARWRRKETKKKSKPEQRIISEDERENMKRKISLYECSLSDLCWFRLWLFWHSGKKSIQIFLHFYECVLFPSLLLFVFIWWCLICLCLFISTSARFCTKICIIALMCFGVASFATISMGREWKWCHLWRKRGSRYCSFFKKFSQENHNKELEKLDKKIIKAFEKYFWVENVEKESLRGEEAVLRSI